MSSNTDAQITELIVLGVDQDNLEASLACLRRELMPGDVDALLPKILRSLAVTVQELYPLESVDDLGNSRTGANAILTNMERVWEGIGGHRRRGEWHLYDQKVQDYAKVLNAYCRVAIRDTTRLTESALAALAA